MATVRGSFREVLVPRHGPKGDPHGLRAARRKAKKRTTETSEGPKKVSKAMMKKMKALRRTGPRTVGV